MSMQWTPEEKAILIERYSRGDDPDEIARDVGRTGAAVRLKAQTMGIRFGCNRLKEKAAVSQIPSRSRDLDTLLRDNASAFQRKRASADGTRSVQISQPHNGPYAILFFGDPHAGDDGCDIEKLCYDLDLVRSEPHVYGANMGDLTNNWVRALGHLYGSQTTTQGDEEKLMEWLIKALDWLFIILGNHDKWSAVAELLCRQHGVLGVSHGGMFTVNTPDGKRPFVVDARHTHKGNSMYNASHGQLKRVYRGSPAHLVIGAHIHTSAVTITKNGVTGRIGHAVRVGSYKRVDDYADASGFDDETISPSVMAVVDPSASDEGFVHVFHDVDQGVRFLRALRNEFNPVSESRVAA